MAKVTVTKRDEAENGAHMLHLERGDDTLAVVSVHDDKTASIIEVKSNLDAAALKALSAELGKLAG